MVAVDSIKSYTTQFFLAHNNSQAGWNALALTTVSVELLLLLVRVHRSSLAR